MSLGKVSVMILGLAFGLLPGAQAQPVSFFRIADSDTPIPGGVHGLPSNFNYFRSASIDGGRVVFSGEDIGNFSGLFTYSSGALSAVATSDMRLPGSSDLFGHFYFASIDGDTVAFISQGVYSPQGVFRAENGNITRIADQNTPVPGGSGNFTSLDDTATIDAGRVLFLDWGTPGLYVGNGSSVVRLADRLTPPPGYPTLLNAFLYPVFDDGNAAFIGSREDHTASVYLASSSQTFELARRGDTAPGTSWQFLRFEKPSIDGSDVAFAAANNSLQSQAGVFLWSGGTLIPIATSDTPVPGGHAGHGGVSRFDHFATTAVSEGNVVFWAKTGDIEGIYAWYQGELRKVIRTDELLDGRRVNFLLFGPESFSGSRIVFTTITGGVEDATAAVYVADLAPGFAIDVPTLGPATLALLAMALGVAAMLRLRS